MSRPDHTFYQYIERMASRGIIAGYPCGGPGEPCNANNDPYFRPGNTVSRGQLTKMVSIAFDFQRACSAIRRLRTCGPARPFTTTSSGLQRVILSAGTHVGSCRIHVVPGSCHTSIQARTLARGQIAKVVNLARTQPTPTPGATATGSPAPTGTPDTPTAIATGTAAATSTVTPTTTSTPTSTP